MDYKISNWLAIGVVFLVFGLIIFISIKIFQKILGKALDAKFGEVNKTLKQIEDHIKDQSS